MLCHAPARTLARTGLLDGLSEDERAAVNRLPDSDPAAALAVNALLARAHEARAGPHPGGSVVTGDPDTVVAVWVESTWCGTRREMLTADGQVHVDGRPSLGEPYFEGGDDPDRNPICHCPRSAGWAGRASRFASAQGLPHRSRP